MTSSLTVPERCIHGNGSVVIVPARVCAYLNRLAELNAFRQANRGVDPEVDAVLIAFRIAELAWRSSATGTTHAGEPELHTPLKWLTTTEAAQRAQVTDRGIRKAISAGQLKAHSVNGRYRINRDDFEHWTAARAA